MLFLLAAVLIGIGPRMVPDMAGNGSGSSPAAFWSAAAAMAGIFLVLLGSVIVGDVASHRLRRAQPTAKEESNQVLRNQLRLRTRELEDAHNQLAEAEDRLVRMEKLAALGQMAGSVAHDLRNPLGTIKNAAYYLKKKLGASELASSNPRMGQFLDIIERQVDSTSRIVTDLTAFARVNGPSLAPTDLGLVVEDALSGMQLKDNIRIAKRFDPGLPQVPADGEQLQRVFANLIMNAQEAMSHGGELTITIGRSANGVEVAFSDIGPGISREDMKKIFDPLFTTKPKGTGLGLAICQRIVANHGGTVDVRTVRGEGTTFAVMLPLQGPGL